MYKKLTREEKYTYMSDRRRVLTNSEILNIISEGGGRVHFIGVGGVSMCSLFCLSRHFGISASGSDRTNGVFTRALIASGEDIAIGERSELSEDTVLVVYSHAIRDSHPERCFARERGISEVSRAEYLGALMQCYERRIGISGSHGKSTVTAMIAKIFTDAALSPTVLSGAKLFGSELPFSIGSLDYLIYEGCEYRDSFLSFSPTVSVFLNMELDHTDYFKDMDSLSKSFLSAMRLADRLIVNSDDGRLLSLAKASGKEFITYGRGKEADYRYEVISERAGAMRFSLYRKGDLLGEVSLPMLGSFNISNATAAISAAMELSVDFCEAAHSLSSFSGIERRLERIGEYKGRALYYDYAHHPSEIKASVLAIKGIENQRITVIFRPHTYSRTKGLWDSFTLALRSADYAVILDIDGVREEKLDGITAQALALASGALYCHGVEEIAEILDRTEGDIVLMGAADVEDIKKYLTNVN